MIVEKERVTILAADDSETNRYIIRRILTKAGFEVVGAATGRETLRLAAQQPDLIVLDINLPDMNGFEICRQLKAAPETKSIPILHLSASFVKSENKVQGLEGGADGYLTQPVEPAELIATINSLLRLRRAEEAARVAAQQWQTTFDAICDGVCLLDREGKILQCNRAMGELLSLPVAEILGRPYYSLVSDAFRCDGQLPVLGVEKRLQRESAEVKVEGGWLKLTADPVFETFGNFTGSVCILSNITGRKQAEEDLHKRNQRLKLLSSTASQLLLSDSPEELLPTLLEQLSSELEWEVYFHYLTGEGGGGWRLASCGGVPEPVARGIERFELDDVASQKAIAELRPVVAEQIQHSAGAKMELLRSLGLEAYACYPLRAHDRLIGALCFGTRRRSSFEWDELVTMEAIADQVAVAQERARLIEELQLQTKELGEANRLKDEFLATLSHELRTPLNAIYGWAQLLRTRKFDDETAARGLETIERSAQSQTQLIETLLDVSQIVQGKLRLNLRSVPVIPAIEASLQAVRPAAEAKAIKLESVLDGSVECIRADASRLQQVLWNLLSNAVKFTPEGGRVELRVSAVRAALNDSARDKPPSASCQPPELSNCLQIQVSDTGIGISADFLPHVFGRFSQADGRMARCYSGLGLGLAMVRHLVELHGGFVRAESPGLGLGATFTVGLPLLEDGAGETGRAKDPESAQALTPLSSHPLSGLRVLVVDVEGDERSLLTAILEEYGARVSAAESATAALEVLDRWRPDILISDIATPSTDGYSLLRQVRRRESERGRWIPAVALTASAGEQSRNQAMAAGFQIHIAKPVAPAELVAELAALVANIPQLGVRG